MNSLVATEARPLRPVFPDEGRNVLALLFAAYPEPFANASATERDRLSEARTAAYLVGIEGIPEWCLREAYKDFVQGRVERSAKSRNKLPTAEEMAVQARVHLTKEANGQARRRAEAKSFERAPEETAEQRTRMKFKMSLLSAAAGESMHQQLLDAMPHLASLVSLAESWGVPVPDEIREQLEQE